MRKRIMASQPAVPAEGAWLDLERLADVELTSEDGAFPIEAALRLEGGPGWRAAGAGAQIIRLIFTEPRRIRRIWLQFVERDAPRTQEFSLKWSPDHGATLHEILRQQWNFSPSGATSETVDHRVDLEGVTVLELRIIPNISGGEDRATLAQLRCA